MSESAALKRQIWAVESLGLQPHDRVLEIGCGSGLAVSLICGKLSKGHVLAMDRSRSMIAKASKKNQEAVAKGKAEFWTGDFSAFDFGRRTFDKVFSFNVNAFWTDPEEDLKALGKVLDRDGLAYFFYLPPSLDQLKKIKERLCVGLDSHGFRLLDTSEKKFDALRAVCLKAARLN